MLNQIIKFKITYIGRIKINIKIKYDGAKSLWGDLYV